MSMMRHKKYLPYVRLSRPGDRTGSWRTAIRMAFYQTMGLPFYVMLQHGFPSRVIDVGTSKREVQQSPLMVRMKRQSFRTWAKRTQALAKGLK